jgi:mannose-6-phosphate isomerase
MHLYEALLCHYDITRDPAVAERSERLLDAVRRTFFDMQNHIVRESVAPNLAAAGRHYEPGHSLEWTWLLGLRSRLFGFPLDPFAGSLYTRYCAAGIAEGRTPMDLRIGAEHLGSDCRLWSQTEALKAHLCMAELGPAERMGAALNRAGACADSILGQWLATDLRGGFFDRYDAEGRMVAADIPGSMPYHLYVAISELSRTLGVLAQEPRPAYSKFPDSAAPGR